MDITLISRLGESKSPTKRANSLTKRANSLSREQIRVARAAARYLHVGHRLDAHPLAQLAVAVEADIRERHALLAVQVEIGELRGGLLEPPLDRLRSAAQDGVELHHHQGIRVRGSEQLGQLGLVLHRLWGGGRGDGPKLSVTPDPLLVQFCVRAQQYFSGCNSSIENISNGWWASQSFLDTTREIVAWFGGACGEERGRDG